jgi:hypothetical protein
MVKLLQRVVQILSISWVGESKFDSKMAHVLILFYSCMADILKVKANSCDFLFLGLQVMM